MHIEFQWQYGGRCFNGWLVHLQVAHRNLGWASGSWHKKPGAAGSTTDSELKHLAALSNLGISLSRRYMSLVMHFDKFLFFVKFHFISAYTNTIFNIYLSLSGGGIADPQDIEALARCCLGGGGVPPHAASCSLRRGLEPPGSCD